MGTARRAKVFGHRPTKGMGTTHLTTAELPLIESEIIKNIDLPNKFPYTHKNSPQLRGLLCTGMCYVQGPGGLRGLIVIIEIGHVFRLLRQICVKFRPHNINARVLFFKLASNLA